VAHLVDEDEQRQDQDIGENVPEEEVEDCADVFHLSVS
jgi:hypothetical protein